MRRLDRATSRALVPELDLVEARRVRWSLDRLHGFEGEQGQAWLEVCFQLALVCGQLDDAARIEARATYRQWAEEDAANADAIAEILPTTSGAELAAARRRRQEANSAWTNRLLQTDAPWAVAIRDRWMNLVNGRSAHELAPFDPAFLLEAPTPRPYDHDARWRPRALSAERVEALADRLRLDQETRIIVRSLFADSRDRWHAELAELAAAVRQAEGAMRRLEGRRVELDPGGIGGVRAARSALRNAVARIDEAFYDDLAALLAPGLDAAGMTEIELSRMSRELERLGVGDWAMGILPEMIVRPVDPIAVLDSLPLDEASRSPARAAILASRPEIIAAARARAEVEAGGSQETQAWSQRGFDLQARAQDQEATEEDRAAARAGIAEAWEKVERLQHDSIAARLQADRAIRERFDEAIAHLDEPLLLEASERYERRAVPEFFMDPRSAQPALDRATALDALPEATRAAVAALQGACRADLARLARRFGDHRRLAPVFATGPDRAARDAERRRAELAILFERDERSARVVSALRRLLDDEQRALVRGLDDYERRTEAPRRIFIRFAE